MQRRLTFIVSLVDVRASLDQRIDHSLMAFLSSQMQRRLTFIVSLVDVRASLDQRIDHSLMAFLSSQMQRRQTVAIHFVNIGASLNECSNVVRTSDHYGEEEVSDSAAGLDQRLDHRLVAFLSGDVQRRRAVVACLVDVRARVHQRLDHRLAAESSGRVQRRLAVVVCLVDVRASLDQRLDHCLVALPSGYVQRRLAIIPPLVHVRTGLDQRQDRCLVAKLNSNVQRRLTWPKASVRRHVDVSASLDQRLDHRHVAVPRSFLELGPNVVNISVVAVVVALRILRPELGQSALALLNYRLEFTYVHTERGKHSLRDERAIDVVFGGHGSGILFWKPGPRRARSCPLGGMIRGRTRRAGGTRNDESRARPNPSAEWRVRGGEGCAPPVCFGVFLSSRPRLASFSCIRRYERLRSIY
ncbi:uncharacterized protein MICPUCDRAFT_66074 [Micromonas pusilla CCMP1545]|uniref:Predicted protein n=1 Tax=Micromonas pusilla (strain CCMP1545) TaxID=564608 RepID=C1NAH1_MICPC|nr:uncharacterized protein MICPUCDRAFT_66074 [Micromonas pusilla CCMP1545]EEH50938.1 predicted protein [Micromonas pusilla CCMP1545]|eukprot:XP_003064958.1 predicted protein [Micromonas pusilla CCMP1545]